MRTRFAPIFLLMILLIAACSPAAEEATTAPTAEEVVTEEPMEAATEEMSAEEMDEMDMTEEADMEATDEAAAPAQAEVASVDYNAPFWANLELVDARTGESFTLADFAGKTVFIEPMATWCSNCRAQQSAVASAMDNLNPDEFVFISLSVEGNAVSDADLASYADRNNFPQVFAVATPDFLNALVDQFGRGITNPPSTPHFIVSPTGIVSELSTGQHSADAVVSAVTAAAGS
ncbi:MAG: TlpA family protein disulfide reductase [Anaerolineae bacterium]|nr:TlpA family protein disulfide reductase [Anaerolineae bacterium]